MKTDEINTPFLQEIPDIENTPRASTFCGRNYQCIDTTFKIAMATFVVIPGTIGTALAVAQPQID